MHCEYHPCFDPSLALPLLCHAYANIMRACCGGVICNQSMTGVNCRRLTVDVWSRQSAPQSSALRQQTLRYRGQVLVRSAEGGLHSHLCVVHAIV